MEEQKVPCFGASITYTVKRKAILVFFGEDFKLEAKFSLYMVLSETEDLFLTASSESIKFKFNSQKISINKQILFLLEDFFKSTNSFIARFKTIEMPFSFSQRGKKGKMTLFFHVIKTSVEIKEAEVSFVFFTDV